MKKILKDILQVVASFVGSYLLLFLLAISFFNLLYKFCVITENGSLYSSLLISAVMAILITAIFMREKKRKQFTRMNQFFLENGIYFLPLYIIICCILLSIDPSIKWTREELKDSISIQWAIFGLSTTIYILLQAFVLKYISDKTPEKKASSAEYTIEKIIFRLCINDKIVPVIFLIANLALIIMATSSVYIIGGKVTLYMQTISIISFYLCTNTLISLFLHIIFPVFDKKIEAMKKTNITQEELVSLNQRIKFAQIRDKLNKILDEIFSSNIQMNESEKEKVKSLLLEGLIREMINGEDASKDKDEDISQ